MYLASCVGVLGQYRMPIDRYWLGMAVQLASYEAQYQVFHGMKEDYTNDNLDTAASNIAGAAAGVFTAYILSWVINICRNFYIARLLANKKSTSGIANCVFAIMRCLVKCYACLHIGRESDILKLDMGERLSMRHNELNDPNHPLQRIDLDDKDSNLFLEAIVGAQEINIWSILMPAVYQLVPGSVIARFWFHSIFPPQEVTAGNQESVFSNLMVISTSLALGLIFGFACVQIFMIIMRFFMKCCFKANDEKLETMKLKTNMTEGMYTADAYEDPDSIRVVEEGDNVVS